MNNQYILFVDPYISARGLCNEFIKNNITPIAVTTNIPFLSKTQREQRFPRELFAECFEYDDPNLLNLLARYNITRVIAGFDASVAVADKLAAIYCPDYANNPETSAWRSNKYDMQNVIKKAGLNSIKQIRIHGATISEEQTKALTTWKWPLITKPTNGFCSTGVKKNADLPELRFNIQALQDLQISMGNSNNEILIQECIEGDEYYVDTVSLHGVHKVTSIFRYKKILHQGAPIYRSQEIVDLNSEEALVCMDYVKSALTTLQLLNGPAHTEVFLTKEGPCLMEVNPRISGGYGLGNALALLASNRDQPTFLVNSILEPKTFIKDHEILPSLSSHGMIVFIQAWQESYLNPSITKHLQKLSSFKELILLKPQGEIIKPPHDLNDAVGLLLLVNENYESLLQDYDSFLIMESNGKLFNLQRNT